MAFTTIPVRGVYQFYVRVVYAYNTSSKEIFESLEFLHATTRLCNVTCVVRVSATTGPSSGLTTSVGGFETTVPVYGRIAQRIIVCTVTYHDRLETSPTR
jgi:hypothetical protein